MNRSRSAALVLAPALVATLAVAPASASPLEAESAAEPSAVKIFKKPTKRYLDGLCKVDTSDPDHTVVRSLPLVGDGCGDRSVAFSHEHETRSVPASWPTWSGPPHTETATPDVLLGVDARVSTVTFSLPTVRAGMEIQAGDLEARRTITAIFRDEKGQEIATVERKLRRAGDARLFAIEADVPIGSVDVMVYGKRPKARHDTTKNSIGNIR
jgi:hypothetical protein